MAAELVCGGQRYRDGMDPTGAGAGDDSSPAAIGRLQEAVRRLAEVVLGLMFARKETAMAPQVNSELLLVGSLPADSADAPSGTRR